MKIKCASCGHEDELPAFKVTIYHHECQLGNYYIVTVECPKCYITQDFQDVETA